MSVVDDADDDFRLSVQKMDKRKEIEQRKQNLMDWEQESPKFSYKPQYDAGYRNKSYQPSQPFIGEGLNTLASKYEPYKSQFAQNYRRW